MRSLTRGFLLKTKMSTSLIVTTFLIVLITLLILLIYFYSEWEQKRYKPKLHPSMVSEVLDKIIEKSATIDNFCQDYQITKEELQVFLGCKRLKDSGRYFYICGLLNIDWLKSQTQKRK